VVALLAGKPELRSMAEVAVRVQQVRMSTYDSTIEGCITLARFRLKLTSLPV
jgi:hypothetical protein